jgi:hypothetical protein
VGRDYLVDVLTNSRVVGSLPLERYVCKFRINEHIFERTNARPISLNLVCHRIWQVLVAYFIRILQARGKVV